MKVIVDFDLCGSHAVCTREAPDIFELDENTDELMIRIEDPDESRRAELERAVKYCPNLAIRIEENG